MARRFTLAGLSIGAVATDDNIPPACIVLQGRSLIRHAGSQSRIARNWHRSPSADCVLGDP